MLVSEIKIGQIVEFNNIQYKIIVIAGDEVKLFNKHHLSFWKNISEITN